MKAITTVVTGKNTRFSYLNANEPKAPMDGRGTPKYSASLIIPKSDTVTVAKIQTAIKAAYDEGQGKLRGNGKVVPKLESLHTPLRDGDEERSELYSGIYGKAMVNFYAYNVNGNKGIAAGFNGLKKLRDGDPLGGASVTADAFEDEDDEDFLK